MIHQGIMKIAQRFTCGGSKGGLPALAAPSLAAPTLSAALCAALALSSCATPMRTAAGLDPAQLLSPGALAVIGTGRVGLEAFAPALLPESARAGLGKVIGLTDRAAFGVYSEGKDARGKVVFEAALAGDYPFRAASLALTSGKGWAKRTIRAGADGQRVTAYSNAGAGVEVALPGPGFALASSGKVDPLLAALAVARPRAAADGSGAAMPPQPVEGGAGADPAETVTITAEEPFARLGEAYLGSKIDLPCRALVITLEPGAAEAPEGRTWSASISFRMESDEDARLYRPAAKTAWFLLGRVVFPGVAQGAAFTATGDTIGASGIVIPEEALVSAIASLAGR